MQNNHKHTMDVYPLMTKCIQFTNEKAAEVCIEQWRNEYQLIEYCYL